MFTSVHFSLSALGPRGAAAASAASAAAETAAWCYFSDNQFCSPQTEFWLWTQSDRCSPSCNPQRGAQAGGQRRNFYHRTHGFFFFIFFFFLKIKVSQVWHVFIRERNRGGAGVAADAAEVGGPGVRAAGAVPGRRGRSEPGLGHGRWPVLSVHVGVLLEARHIRGVVLQQHTGRGWETRRSCDVVNLSLNVVKKFEAGRSSAWAESKHPPSETETAAAGGGAHVHESQSVESIRDNKESRETHKPICSGWELRLSTPESSNANHVIINFCLVNLHCRIIYYET